MIDSHSLHHRRAFGAHARHPQLDGNSSPDLTDFTLSEYHHHRRSVPPGISTLLGLTTSTTSTTSHVTSTTKTTSTTTSKSTTGTSSTTSSTSATSSTSTASSTSTTSTTRSTTTASSTSKSTSHTVTSTTPAAHVTSAPMTTTNPVVATILSASSASPSATATNVAATSTRVSTGVVVGGIGAAVIAVVALISVIAFFLRRSRKRSEFDAQDFRRSAIVINDAPTDGDTKTHGFNPRSSVMIERHLASPAPTFGTKYGAPGPNYGNQDSGGYPENVAGFGSHFQSHAPGQVMNISPGAAVPPILTPAIHNQSPLSHVHSPISEQQYFDQQGLARQPSLGANGYPAQGGAVPTPISEQQYFDQQNLARQSSLGASGYPAQGGAVPTPISEQQYFDQQGLVRQPSTGANGYPPQGGPVHAPISEQQRSDQQGLARQPSTGVIGHPPQGGTIYPVLTRQPSTLSPFDVRVPLSPAAVNDYIDLDRSSVSPYQAAQYVEISRRLNTEVPRGLSAADTERDLPPLPQSGQISPFADPEPEPEHESEPEPSSASPTAQFAIDHRNLNRSSRRKSGDSISSVVSSNTLDFPVPPSPAYTVASRYRIDSTPPMLPEIRVESRASMTSYSDTGHVFSGGLRAISQKFPTTPSPLASSFGIPMTPTVEDTFFTTAAPSAHSFTSPPTSPTAPDTPTPDIPTEKKRSTTYSQYGAEDAYGGI